jgi:hypothetical protein
VTYIAGYRIVAERHLRKPRLERERFSGGRNLSAAERNRKRLADAKKVFALHGQRVIVVPDWFVDEFIAELRNRIPTNEMEGGWL